VNYISLGLDRSADIFLLWGMQPDNSLPTGYILLGLNENTSKFLLLGMGNVGPPPPPASAATGVRLWQAGPKGVRTRIVVRSWDDDSTKT
jgi:hypothetical protein